MSKFDFRFLTKLTANYSPTDVSAKSLRSFLQGVTSDHYRTSNPACQVNLNVADKFQGIPSLHVDYKNGKKLEIKDTSKLTAVEIAKDFWRVPKVLMEEEESKS